MSENSDSKTGCKKFDCRNVWRGLIGLAAGIGMVCVAMFVSDMLQSKKISSFVSVAKDHGDSITQITWMYGLHLLFWFGVFVVLSRILLFTMRDDD